MNVHFACNNQVLSQTICLSMELKDFLKERLAAKGGTQAKASRTMKVSEAAISRWMDGRSEPEYETCLRLASYLGVDPREIFDKVTRRDEFIALFERFSPGPRTKAKDWSSEIELRSDFEKSLVEQLLEILRIDPGGAGAIAENGLAQLAELASMKKKAGILPAKKENHDKPKTPTRKHPISA